MGYDEDDYRGYHNVPLYGQKLLGLDPSGAEMACWYAAAKMVLDTGGVTSAANLKALFPAGASYNNIQIAIILSKFGFTPVGGAAGEPWTADRIESSVLKFGPLLASGAFGDPTAVDFTGKPQHCIVVVGILEGWLVRYNDPWQPKRDWMPVHYFTRQLSGNHDAMLFNTKHYKGEFKTVGAP